MKYQSFITDVDRKVNSLMFNVIDAVTKNTERKIKQAFTLFPKPPVDTGTLRRSITGKVLKNTTKEVIGEVRASTTGIVGLGKQGKGKKGGKIVEYAKYIEYGTVKMAPRPFMRQGATNALKSNEQIIKKLLR